KQPAAPGARSEESGRWVVPQSNRLRTTAALATSALLHLGCALLVLRAVSHARALTAARASPARIEISLIETDRTTPARAPSPDVPVALHRHPGAPERSPQRRQPAGPPREAASPVGPAAPGQLPPAPARSARPPNLSFDALAEG